MRGDLWEVDQIRIQTTLPGYKAPGLWRPVGVTLMPRAHLDSPIIFDIELPPGSVGGAMVDRSAMRYFGVKSAPQYAASIGLPYYWNKFGTHRNGTRPIQATRPRILRNREGLALGDGGEVLLDQRGLPVAGFNDERLVFLDKSGKPVQGRTLAQRRKLAARRAQPIRGPVSGSSGQGHPRALLPGGRGRCDGESALPATASRQASAARDGGCGVLRHRACHRGTRRARVPHSAD